MFRARPSVSRSLPSDGHEFTTISQAPRSSWARLSRSLAIALLLAVPSATVGQDPVPTPAPADTVPSSKEAAPSPSVAAPDLGDQISATVAAALPDGPELAATVATAAGADPALDLELNSEPDSELSSPPAPSSAGSTVSPDTAHGTTGVPGQIGAAQPAPDDTAQSAAGNGGTAGATADGGIVITSAIITGNNRGNEITVAGCGSGYGALDLDGGEVVNESTIDVSADGGTAIGDATGGDANAASSIPGVVPSSITVGNGGSAGASADGGIVITSAMITGNNRGNEIDFAGCPAGSADAPAGDGTLIIDGGVVENETTITISADGGTAIADAAGGDENIAGGLATGAVQAIAPGNAWVAAGGGGTASASADGGIVITSAIITGNNRGNEITVGTVGDPGTTSPANDGCLANVVIDGGTISNESVIDISVDGGLAIADASGGGANLGATEGIGGVLSLGTGGDASAAADGGILTTNAIITGNNRGSEITVGDVGCLG